MATQTLVVASVCDESGVARLEVDYDDTTDPLNPDLIAIRVVNGMTRPCLVSIRRAGQAPWFEIALIPAGQTVSQNVGGPVQQLSDIPNTMLTTR